MFKKDDNNCAIVVALNNVRKHPNADRLQLATVLGTTVVVGLDSKEGDVVAYFDSNVCLSHEFLHENNLYSDSTLNKDTTKKGYFGKSGRVRTQKFRGELSNGFIADMNLFDYIDGSIVFEEGTQFNSVWGYDICKKYIPNTVKGPAGLPKQPKSTMFHKHWDTKQLMRELGSVQGVLYIEEKIHGTSGRTGNVLCNTGKKWWQFWKPLQEWKVLSGTRRVDNVEYHIPQIRKEIEAKLAPHLHKGEEVYYEIYGYDGGKEIQIGFPYDCKPGEYKAMLYRVTITTPDGYVIDLDRRQIYQRANELGLESPMMLCVEEYKGKKWLEDLATELVVGQSTLDVGTLREGIVVWFQGYDNKWTCLKHKNPDFLLNQDKQLENNEGDPEDIL